MGLKNQNEKPMIDLIDQNDVNKKILVLVLI